MKVEMRAAKVRKELTMVIGSHAVTDTTALCYIYRDSRV